MKIERSASVVGLKAVALVLGVLAAVVSHPDVALAASDTFSNTNTITINSPSWPDPSSAATPYPATITASGFPQGELVTDVDVTLHGLSHSWPSDVDVLLVGPTGRRVMLMSDVGGGNGYNLTGADLTFDDEAAGPVPYQIPSGAANSYRPTNFNGRDSDPFLYPAPPGPYRDDDALSDLDGESPDGTYSLYVIDDFYYNTGRIQGGFSVTITTADPANFACSDGQDNDGDGKTDFPDDPGCAHRVDDSEDSDRAFVVNDSADAVDADPGDGTCQTATQGECTLRAAIMEANASANVADTINFSVDTVTLTRTGSGESGAATGDLDIADDLTVNGGGVVIGTNADETANTGFDDRVLHVLRDVDAKINDATIQNGRPVYEYGGGIYSQGTLTLTRSTVRNNTAQGAGGIIGTGPRTTITESTVNDNSARTANYGAVYLKDGGSISNSTVSGNQASGGYGGVTLDRGNFEVTDSTIAFNKSGGVGGGLIASGATVTAKNTIVAGNTTRDCYTEFSGTITSEGNNLSGDASCGFNQPSDKPDTAPLLATLGDYGGPTQTHALQGASPAIDAGATDATTDQRGAPRPGEAADDIGAFERQPDPTFSVLDTSVTEGNSGTTDATFGVAVQSDEYGNTTRTIAVDYATSDDTATAGSDYGATSGTLSFAPGEISKTVNVPVTGDTTDEPDETFTLTLSNASGATMSDASATGTIIDDDDDTSAPDTAITEGPSGTVGATSATFAFSSETGATFECRLDEAEEFTSCESGIEYTNLSEGSHAFEVRAKDSAGNTDETPASRTWSVDATAPDTKITSGPTEGSTVASTDQTFSFTSTESGSTFKCSVDNGAYQACSSGDTFTFTEGPNTFKVKATDAAGNEDSSAATRTFTVDTTPDTTAPRVTSTSPSGKKVAGNTNVTATFSEEMDEASIEAPGTITLVLKGKTTPVAATVSYDTKMVTLDPIAARLQKGTYRATITTGAKDLAGNALAQPVTWTFTVK